MRRVTHVEALDGCRIATEFSDGLRGVVDLSDLAGKGVFARLSDPLEFAKVFVDPVTHTVAWPGGIDLCSDALYEEITRQQKAA